MKKYDTGLFLGKFAPFHKGHQYVVETALAEVGELLVVIYDCPETTDIPLSVRAEWIRELYPRVTVVEGWALPTGTGYTKAEKREHEDAIQDLLGEATVDAFYSSEPYGEHMSKALGAVDRRVDPDREVVPISGTAVRENPYSQREFVSDLVYRDLVSNVVFLGGPSTGKSTLAEQLAQEFDTEWMPEYGREYWLENEVNGQLTQGQLVDIAEGHIKRENERLAEAREYLFTDTNAITTLGFSQLYHGESRKRLIELANNCHERYDFVFVCDTDIEYDDTWDRSGVKNQERLHKRTLAYLNQYGIPYVVLEGSVSERVATVKEVLACGEANSMEQKR